MTKQLRNGSKIEFTGYRSALKHRNELKAILVAAGGEVKDTNNSTATGSYYLEVLMGEILYSFRLSNHTKPDTDNVAIDAQEGTYYYDFSIISMEDYKAVLNFIKSKI